MCLFIVAVIMHSLLTVTSRPVALPRAHGATTASALSRAMRTKKRVYGGSE